MATKRQFIPTFKLEAVRQVKYRMVSVTQATRDLDVHENDHLRWKRQLTAKSQQAFPVKDVMKSRHWEIEWPKHENVKLPKELDILKKPRPTFPK